MGRAKTAHGCYLVSPKTALRNNKARLPFLEMRRCDAILGYTGLRVAMGMAMLIHGVARIGSVPAFVANMLKMFAQSVLPAEAIRIFAWFTPFIELLIGVSVVFGLLRRGGLFGSTLVQNYNVVGVQLIYSIVLFLLLTHARFNVVSLDHWLGRALVGRG